MFKENDDITKILSDFEDISDVENAADIYKRAQRVISKARNKEMRNQGIKAFPGDFTKDHPPTLLKNKTKMIIYFISYLKTIFKLSFPVWIKQ